jgi:hypothetical protein
MRARLSHAKAQRRKEALNVVAWQNASGRRTSISPKGVIRIAVEPAFTGLPGGDDRVSAGVRVLGRVAIRRTVAAESHSARLARSQMDPARADLDAFTAFHALRKFHFRDRIEVGAV